MNRINWVVDTRIFSNEMELMQFVRGINNTKHPSNIFVTKYAMFDDDAFPLYFGDKNTVIYGTINFCEHIRKKVNSLKMMGALIQEPYMFGLTKDIECQNYLTKFPKEWLLNSDYVFVPFQRLVEDPHFFYNMYQTNNIFIRPNSGGKVFTGQCIPNKDFDYEVNCLKQLTGVVDSTMIVVAPAQKIKSETRCVIVNKQVVNASTYNIGNINYYDQDTNIKTVDVNSNVMQLAEQVAKYPYQIDHCYVVDIAELENGDVKIVEFNAFSCAGFYTFDYTPIINAVNETITLINKQELVLER